MARPHPVLLDLAAGRPVGRFPDRDDGLLASAVDHGMHGLLWTWVRDREPRYPLRTRLAGIDAATRRHHDLLWRTLVEVQCRLAAVGIEVAAVKGVTTEARWYARPGERPSSDVDVLVAPEATARAGALLRALDPAHPLVDDLDTLVREGGVQAADLHLGEVAVDVHFDLLKLGYPMRDPDAAWARTAPWTAPDGTTLRVLGPELALVHLLVHANKDSFPRLLGFADVVHLARGDLDWDVVAAITRDEGLDDVVGCTLDTVAATLGLPPFPVRARPTPRARVWRATWPERVTLLGSAGTSRSRRQEVLPFLVRGRTADALRAAVRILLPARAAVAHRYADVRGPYPVRLARGRWRSQVARRRSLRARTAPRREGGPPTVDGRTTASLLRAHLGDGAMWLDVAGRSMGWSIPGGWRVRVVAAAQPRRGEVWAFCTPTGELVVHRARRVEPDGYVFQGDARVTEDPPVPADHLVGRVVELEGARALRWGVSAGALQREPRRMVATVVRGARRVRGSAGE